MKQRAAAIERKSKSGEIRLGPLNVPLRLLEALRGDRLIIFAGAGVSKPSPSDLPDFEKLTEQIAEGLLERKSGEPPDIFLGRLAQNGVSVHEKAARILGVPSSRHNDLHHLLVGLFPSTSKLRIVTTNFDHHFEGAITDRWPTHDIDIYAAPALPIGSRFSGLVYVHGRIGKDPQNLVLTDSDFGKAYLTEGWARRFLREMFASYDVLFIGYSHEDVVLRYLARGLPPTHERVRFALTPDDPERWQFLGITPIQYDPADHHIAAREGLKAWLDLEGRGPLGHEREIYGLVTRSPQALTEQEDDYLLFCVRDATLAQFFFRHASDAAWLVWASDRSVLTDLFDPNGASSIAYQVASWFMQEALSERGDVARELVYKANRLSPQLWLEIARAVWLALDSDDQPPEAAKRAAQWLSILDRHDEVSSDRELVCYWLKPLAVERYAFLAAQVFSYLLHPIVVPEMGLTHDDNGELRRILRPSIKVRGSRHWLSAAWEQLFKPNLHLFAFHLIPVILAHLQHAHLLVRSHGIGSYKFDPMSYRSAIEPHEQNRHGINESFDFLIDAGRDVIDWFLEHDPRSAEHIIEAWLPVEVPLIQRLCIYGLTRHPRLDSNAKINRVVTEQWLGKSPLRHEVFFLLRGAYKHSSTTARRRLLREAERAYVKQSEVVYDDPVKEEESRAYELLKFLTWLQEADPECSLVAARLQKLIRKYPQFDGLTLEHLDFTHWSGGVQSVQYISPVSAEGLLKLEPAEWLKTFDETCTEQVDPRRFFERRVLGLLAETEKGATQDFDWGMKLAECLAAEERWEHSGWHYLLRSWSSQPLTELQWRRLMDLLQEHKEIFRHADDIADILQRRIENRDNPPTEEVMTEGITIANELWVFLSNEEGTEDSRDWVQEGLNKAGGKLGLFIVHALSHSRSLHKEDWSEIPDLFRPLLERMAHAGPDCSPFGRVMLCSQLHFFFAIDPSWTKQNLFPLFDWSLDAKVAVQAWHGFLVWGRPTRELVAEFMPKAEQTFDHLAELGNFRNAFTELLVSIGYRSLDNPLEVGWLKTFLRKSQPADRIEWAKSIGSILHQIDHAERKRWWNAWLRAYFDFRIASVIPLEEGEWREMIKWSIHLEDVLPEVVELLSRRPSVKVRDTSFYYQLKDQEGLLRHPSPFADLLLYLLQSEEGPFYDVEHLAEVFPELLNAGAPKPKLRRIVDRLAELGLAKAQELANLIDDIPS